MVSQIPPQSSNPKEDESAESERLQVAHAKLENERAITDSNNNSSIVKVNLSAAPEPQMVIEA